MRRFLKILLTLLAIFIVVALAVPFLIPADNVKNEVLAQIEAHTGRKVTIEHLRFSVFPMISLDAQGVKVSNPAWAGGGDMAQIKTLKLGLELLPLLHKEVHLKELTLVQPVLKLVKQKGRTNWDFSKEDATITQTQATTPGDAGNSFANLHLGAITIEDGSATYQDDMTPKPETLSEINLSIKAPHFSESAEISFAALYNGKKAEVLLTLSKPLDYQKGSPTDASLKVSYGALGFSWVGTATLQKNGVPNITGTITIPSLNLADFAQKTSGVPAAAPASAPVSSNSSRWSDAPLSFDGLARVDTNLTLAIGTLILPQTTLKNINVAIHLAQGDLHLEVGPIEAYSGTVQLSLSANTAGAIALNFAASHAQAEPLLHDFAGYDRLSGAIDMQTKLTTSGKSEHALINALSGTGSLDCKDGKLKGVNIVGLLRNLTGIGALSEDAVTDFSRLSATYTIAKGIVTSNDLTINSSLLHVSGVGQADLPNWQEHFVLKALLVASGGKNPSGLTVPILVEGPLDHPHYQPDLKGVIADNLKDPAAFKQDLKDVKKSLLQGGGLNNLLR